MCGIGGIILAARDATCRHEILVEMKETLRHRGPDDHGIREVPGCGLVHTRLAILDLSRRARQPMESRSGRYLLTYNGEIYNFRQLRGELEQGGVRFSTRSDTEVIVELAERDGVGGLERLEGMFALGLYDRETHELVLLRDRLGIKPLFWAELEGGFAFASEPKALRGLVAREAPEPGRIAEFLAFRNLLGRETLLPGCRTLPPGGRLRTDGRHVEVDSWGAPAPSSGGRPSPEQLGETIRAAVERQRVSDAPVGVFLSGGVDSSLVAGALAEVGGPYPSFSVGFEEKAWDETERAGHVAAALGLDMKVLHLDEARYTEGLGAATWHLDAPLNHAHSVHLLELARFARKTIKVTLTGEGGDELFAGYPRYRIFLAGRSLSRLPGAARLCAGLDRQAGWSRMDRLLAAAGREEAEAAALNAAFVRPEEAARLAGCDPSETGVGPRAEIYRAARSSGATPLGALLALERRTYLVSLLQRMDRLTMAAGLEARVPLLDERVVELALAAPPEDLADPWQTKKPLRHLAARRYGRNFAHAPKSGFGVPLGEWLRRPGPFSEAARRILGGAEMRARGWLDCDRLGRLLKEHRDGLADRSEILWGALALELWARVCLEGGGPEAALAR